MKQIHHSEMSQPHRYGRARGRKRKTDDGRRERICRRGIEARMRSESLRKQAGRLTDPITILLQPYNAFEFTPPPYIYIYIYIYAPLRHHKMQTNTNDIGYHQRPFHIADS